MSSIRKRMWNCGKPNEKTCWIIDYRDQHGRRHIKSFKTKREADQWAITALHEVREGTHTPISTSKTVAEIGALWIANGEADRLERSTINQRKVHLKVHIVPFLGDEKLSSLSTPRIYQLDSDLRTNGRSVAMRRKIIGSLKAMLAFAQSQGFVAQNVARSVKVKSDARNQTSPLREGENFPSKAELRAMMDSAPDRWRALLITAIFSGLRVSELRGLRWQDVDFDNDAVPMLHVRQRADNWGKIGPPKSKAGSRDIPLPPLVANTLRQWKAGCPASPLDLVFAAPDGAVESYFTIRNSFWIPLQIALGMTTVNAAGETTGRYGFHCLRHAAASLFIEHLGWTPKRVQTVLGHSSIQMTFDRYGHLFEDRESDREAMKKLEAAVVAA